ncbi:uncharacterized protein LOC113508809 [Trichoplusia ni]|uniref:Uncharacterized protein LOC113508809 n=1 Tax=Trichoplusia ni TaxID=7111 RepID=A0A7E5X5B0_TRINI|nr:uncharacterized protein LOC113508809 [Trichoplusia ni]
MVKHKRNNSESDGADHREQVFRISVCLKQFFQDERALVCMQVSSAQPVRWLRRRLRRAFSLPRALRLLSRGHLLPPDEPLAILERDDLVAVVAAPQHALHPDGLAASDHIDDSEMVELPTTQARDRSPSPGIPDLPDQEDNLLERKRKAIQLLDQFFTVEGQNEELVLESPVQRPARRRRVRRRRRTMRPFISKELVEHDSVSSTPPEEVLDMTVGTADENDETRAVDETVLSCNVVSDDASVVEVLRNISPPRAPRVVRPLALLT